MADADERYRVAMQQCDHLASEILAERVRHERELGVERERGQSAQERAHAAEVRADRLEHQLNHARAVIKDMERSRFWRMRTLWVRLSRGSRT